MATPQEVSNHNSIIQNLIDRFDEFLESATKTLENTVADRVLSATDENSLLETRIPINRDFDEIFDRGLRDFMGEFDPIARDVISWTPGEVTDADRTVVAELKKQSYARLNETVKSTRENIHTEIMMGALAGVAVQSIAETTRHRISGLMITTSNLEATRLQNKLRRLRAAQDRNSELIAETLQKLKKQFAGVSVGGSLASQSSAEMHDLVMDFDGVFIRHRGRQAGLDRYRYTGTLVSESRDFCIRNVDRVFTEEEAKSVWASQSWSGKRSGDPFIVRGGHRCRHFWVPVGDD